MPALLAALVLSSIDASVDPQAFQRTIARATPATDGIPVEQLRIDLGPASLTIAQGKLVPVEGMPGRTQELLVLGEGRFALSTDDPVESYQVELYSGERRIDAPVTSAVLVVPNDQVVDELLARPGRRALSAAELDAARTLLASWRESPE